MIHNIGQKIKTLRLTHCLSQKAIADQLDISVPAYSKIETGLTDISFNKLQQIADIYCVTIIDILEIGEKEANNDQHHGLKKQLEDLTEIYNAQQKKMIQLYEVIRSQKG